MRDGGLVTLMGAAGRLLRAPPDGFEQPPDMDRMVGNTACEANDDCHPRPGPDLSPEAEGFGPALQERRQAGQLFAG